MPAVAAGALILGTGIKVYGALKGASDQANIEEQKAGFAREQADEVLARESINEGLRNDAAFRNKLSFGAAYAGTGKAGVGIGSMLEIQRQTDLQNALSKRDAEFQAAQLRKGAALQEDLAGNTRTAGYISAAGTLLGSAGKIIDTGLFTSGKTTGLPSMPGGS